MPSPLYAIDLLKTALRMKGIIATGETPPAELATDALRALNDVLERWSIESYAVNASLPTAYTTVSGQSTYAVGPRGDWDGDRPVSIDFLFTSVGPVDYPAEQWTLPEYLAVPVKTQQQLMPERFVFLNDGPFARVILYPTPSDAIPITISTPRILTQVPNISTLLTLPPGYAGALQYAVAEELGVQFGSPIDLSAQARSSLAIVKRANRQSPIMSFDSSLTSRGASVGANGGFAGGNIPDQWSATEW